MRYEILTDAMEKLEKELKKIERKCNKYGCPFEYKIIGTTNKIINKNYYDFTIVELSGMAIINDYELIGIIKREDNKNIVNSVNGSEVPKRFWNTDNYCEHCNSKRNRNTLFILRNTKTNEYKQKSKETSIKHFGADNCTKSSLWKEKWYGNKEWSEKRNDNIYNSMIKNGSFHNSKPESIILNFLRENYPDVINQYKDERYPFKCDYYIPSKDLFIEYNGYWTHGGHFFDETNPEDVNQLKMWENSDKKQYKNARQTWTVRDINKLKKAKENKLNFIVLWYDDFKDLNKIKEMVDRF